MIKPTIGRVVWFWPMYNHLPNDFSFFPLGPQGPQPCAATVCYVWSDHCVNLSVTDHGGKQHSVSSVPLLQENDPKPDGGFFCEWMPYQIGQAKKDQPPPIPSNAIYEQPSVGGGSIT